jgi:hypothetical protein
MDGVAMDTGNREVEKSNAQPTLLDGQQSKEAGRPTQEDADALFMLIRQNAQDRHRSFIRRAAWMWIECAQAGHTIGSGHDRIL